MEYFHGESKTYSPNANPCMDDSHGLKCIVFRLNRLRAKISSFSRNLFVGDGCTMDGPIPSKHHFYREAGEE